MARKLNLTDNAKTTLKKRYLQTKSDGKQETYVELFDRISRCVAKAELNYTDDENIVDKWSDKFYEMLTNLDFSPNSPTIRYAGSDKKGCLSACCHPSQYILSVRGSKRIFDVVKNDIVITHTGKRKRVSEVMQRHYSGDMYTIDVRGMIKPTLKVTSEHPLLILKKDDVKCLRIENLVCSGSFTNNRCYKKKLQYKDNCKRVEEGYNIIPSWVNAEDVKVGDYVVVNFDKTVSDERIVINLSNYVDMQKIDITEDGYLKPHIKPDISHKIPQCIEVTPDVMRLFGYWLAEGHLCKDRNFDVNGKYNCVGFSFSDEEFHYAYDVQSIMKSVFGIETKIEYANAYKGIHLRYHSIIIADLFFNLFGTGSTKKSIPDLLYTMPNSHIIELLSGLFRGDGHYKCDNVKQKKVKLSLANKLLIEQVMGLLYRFGCDANITPDKSDRYSEPCYNIIFPPYKFKELCHKLGDYVEQSRKIYNAILTNDYVLKRIDKVDVDYYDGIVYNFEVEDDNSYIANGVAVHNCCVLGVDDSRKSIFHTLQDTVEAQARGLGTGYNFSRIRPKGDTVESTGGLASGPLSFMSIYDVTVGPVIAQGGFRRGAQMGILNCLSGDTVISTIDGKKMIKDLVGTRPYLYCVDDKWKVRVRKAAKVFSNGMRQIVKVKFDDDTILKCTPDHRILLIDGTYKKAGELVFGDSVAILNKKLNSNQFHTVKSSNHKVVSVTFTSDFVEVFDITMSEFHNFVANGVFVHNCDHPDIFDFITVKRKEGILTSFNLSVGITDDFMEAVKNNALWDLKFKGKVYRTIKARDLWDKIIEGAWHLGEPGVIFMDAMASKNPLYDSGYIIESTNPCGEQKLPIRYDKEKGYSVGLICNLGSINLANHYSYRKEDIDWKRLKETIHKSVRFLDNVIDVNYYPLEGMEEEVKKSRLIGLGVMGWADLLLLLKIKYGSDESIELAREVGMFINDVAEEASRELAKERGAYPLWKEGNRLNPESIRNASRSTIAPTGCGIGSTLLCTGDGLLTYEEIAPQSTEQWTNLNLSVMSLVTDELATKFYRNGNDKVVRLVGKYGSVSEFTHSHQFKVWNLEDRVIEWKSVKDISVGDHLLKRINQYKCKDGYRELLIPDSKSYGRQKDIIFPTVLDEDLAKFIGYYMADGVGSKDFTSHYSLEFSVGLHEKELVDSIEQLSLKLFGLVVKVIEREQQYRIVLRSKYLIEFMDLNKFLKIDYSHANIPKLIRMSSRSVIWSFLSGLYSGDGCIRKDDLRINYKTGSKILSYQLQNVLLSLGVVVGVHYEKEGKDITIADRVVISNGSYNLYPINVSYGKELGRHIRFTQKCKEDIRYKLLNYHISSNQGDLIPIDSSDVKSKKVRNSLYMRRKRGIPLLVPRQTLLDEGVVNDFIINNWVLEEVKEKEEIGYKETFDISVPSNNAYIAGGFISHNSISIICGCSGGIEPNFAWQMDRSGQLDGQLGIEYHPMAEEYLKEGVDLPDYFVTTRDVSTEDHVRMLAVWQENVNSAVSKTINAPNDATLADVDKAFMLAYDLGCKGVTFYRDGSRKFQVLSTVKQKKRRKNGERYELPDVMSSRRINMTTPRGKASLFIVMDDMNTPVEFYVNPPIESPETAAIMTAICRLIAVGVQGYEDMEEYLDQLKKANKMYENKNQILTYIIKALQGAKRRKVNPGIEVVKDLPLEEEDMVEVMAIYNIIKLAQSGNDDLDEYVSVLRYTNKEYGNVSSVLSFLIKAFNKFSEVLSAEEGRVVVVKENCPECGQKMILKEGCETCPKCAYSKCG